MGETENVIGIDGSGDDLQGAVVAGKYKLQRQIGAGGMGAVYEAKHTGTERIVAVKFLKADLAGDEEALIRFEREAKAAGRIDHDNICEVYDYGVDEGSPYIAMPLLKGRPLDWVITQASPMPIQRACDIASQTLSALGAAHGVGLVHRDLKPENIFLTTVGDRQDFVKVLDFGISKALSTPGKTSKEQTLTSQGTILGTPFYMAPEQARGKKVDGRIDIYAMGVILYEMFTGQRPIKGTDIHDILANIFFTPIPTPRSLRPDLPEELQLIVLKSMARDVGERYQTAEEMRADIVAVSGRPSRPSAATPATLNAVAVAPGQDISTKPETPRGKVNETGRDGLFPNTLIESVATPDPVVNTMYPIRERSRGKTTMIAATLAVLLVLGGIGSWYFMIREPSSEESGPPAVTANEVRADAGSAAGEPVASARTEIAASEGPTTAAARGGSAESDTEPAVPAEPNAPTAEDELGVAEDMPTAEVVAAPDTVRITLEGLPEDASVSADGEAVEGPTFDLARSGDSVRLVVRADGYRSWQQTVSAEEPATIRVRMQRRDRDRREDSPRRQPNLGEPRPARSPVTSFGAMP